MITQESAAAIWTAYREIATAEKLLADMESEMKWEHDKTAPVLKDAFGRKRNLQLGIPSGENSHRLFDVPPKLAGSVIRAHIAQKRAELAEANEQARIDLMGDGSAAQRIESPETNVKEATAAAEEWCEVRDAESRNRAIYCYTAGYIAALSRHNASLSHGDESAR